MDLKVKDVAELLNVPESTIRKWSLDSKIPSYKINGQLRFSRPEIESWVLELKLGTLDGSLPFSKIEPKTIEKKSSLTRGGSQKFSLYRALHKGVILEKVPGNNKEEVIRAASKLLSKQLKLDSEMLAELLLDRERLHPTALNHGLAVPHTREFLLSPSHDVVAIAFPEKPIPFGALDGKPVDTLIFLFACNDKRHLHLLAKIAHLSSQEEARALLQGRPSKEEMLSYVEAWEESIGSPSEDD